jgi:hypothetical protein
MKKRQAILSLLTVFLGSAFLSFAQFTPEEIGERAKWETFLETAGMAGEKQIGGGEVKTAPWILDLEKDGTSRRALWKNPEGQVSGHEESWKWEIAAYRLDKFLELNMVPPTVERVFRGKRGSCQLWVTAEMDLMKKNREKIETPSDRIYAWNNGLYLTRAFDNLIANTDRHAGTILITKDWRWILIDHSRSFGTSDKLPSEGIIAEERQGAEIIKRLPRTFVEKLKALNIGSVKEVVGNYLTEEEIKAVLKRRDLILKEIARLIEKYGEGDVLYLSQMRRAS